MIDLFTVVDIKRKMKIENLIVIFLLITLALACGARQSHSAVMPAFERLNPIIDNLNAPTAVAIDNYGSIYVAESVNNRIQTYSQGGAYKDSLTGLHKPISVAVDSSGRIYAGNKNTGNVEVYDADFNFLFKLGSGNNEFGQPGAIAIAASGKIFVADSNEDVVKVYNSDGSSDFTFGGTGSTDGLFNFPTSIAIDEAAGEIIVSELQFTTDMYGAQIEGARIQIFDMNGVYRRSFGQYGTGEGTLGKPMGVTVDGESRIYVTDALQHIVHVFDNTGTFLGTVYDAVNTMRNPLGIMMASSNKLYVASLTTGTLEVYGVGLYTDMDVAPLSLTFQGQAGSQPADQGIQINNNGLAVLNWTAGANENWITLSQTSGTTAVGMTSVVNAGADPGELAEGTYTGTISISSDTGITELVSVTLTVLPTPELSINPSSLAFTSTNGSTPASQNLIINNTGGGTLTWSAVSDSGWLMMNKETGIAPDSFAVTVDITSMSVGTYNGAITVTGEGALSSPAVIPVTLNIVESTGSINVSANISQASFTINGPASYSGKGANWSTTDAPVGTYTIVFGDARDYITPSPESLTLQENGTITFTGQYIAEGSQANCSAGGAGVRIASLPPRDHVTLQEAYDDTLSDEEIRTQGITFNENLAFDLNKSIIIQAGDDCDFSGSTGSTTINGNMTISDGVITVETGTIVLQ
jgi:hypothetical protein